MQNAATTLILFMLATCSSWSQFERVDTLFKSDELMNFSDLERTALKEYLDGKPDFLKMIAAINPGTDERELGLYRDWIEEIITEIDPVKIKRLSQDKQIERIEKYVDKALLLTFKYEADFDDLFSQGNYNYFTGAAIYAFILERLDIPYEIYELPTHLYFITFPRSARINFTPVTPGYPYFMFAHETRTNFVEFIHDQGVIDNMTFHNTSTRELFQQFYFSDRGLSIREMVGMLYVNSAIRLLMEEKTQQSYAQLEKAFLIYPSYKTQYMMLVQLNGYLMDMDYRDPLDLGYLIKASRLIEYGVSFELVNGYLAEIVGTVLVDEEDQEKFSFIYEYLMEFIKNQELRDNFTYYYLYESGRLEFNESHYLKALEYFEPAFKMRTDDDRISDLLVRSLGGYSLMVSPVLVLEKIHEYDTSFTEITGEGIYLMVKSQTYLSLFGESFQLKDGKTAEKYMQAFEDLMEKHPETSVDHIMIGRSYSSAAIYYYREGQINRSKEVLNKGLSYAPDNIELKLKLQSFE